MRAGEIAMADKPWSMGPQNQRAAAERLAIAALAFIAEEPERLGIHPHGRPRAAIPTRGARSWLARSRFSLLLPRKTRSRRARSWKRVVPSPDAVGSATRREALSQHGAMPQQARGRLPGFCRDCR